jgi:hypothetical protein
MEAAAGNAWPRETVWDDRGKPVLRTQRRWLEQGAALLGLSQPLELSELIRDALRLPGLDHRESGSALASGRTLVERGAAVTRTLAVVSLNDQLWPRLLTAGHLAGLWGPPSIWRAGRVERLFPAGTGRLRGEGRGPPA